MSTPLIPRQEANGAPVQAVPAAMPGPAEYRLPGTMTGIGAQVSAAIVLLTGVWSNGWAGGLLIAAAAAGLAAVALRRPARR